MNVSDAPEASLATQIVLLTVSTNLPYATAFSASLPTHIAYTAFIASDSSLNGTVIGEASEPATESQSMSGDQPTIRCAIGSANQNLSFIVLSSSSSSVSLANTCMIE